MSAEIGSLVSNKWSLHRFILLEKKDEKKCAQFYWTITRNGRRNSACDQARFLCGSEKTYKPALGRREIKNQKKDDEGIDHTMVVGLFCALQWPQTLRVHDKA